jgi:hypothetical protein
VGGFVGDAGRDGFAGWAGRCLGSVMSFVCFEFVLVYGAMNDDSCWVRVVAGSSDRKCSVRMFLYIE